MSSIRIAVVGATGMVGQEFLRLLEERRFPARDIRLMASKRSAGTQIQLSGQDILVSETIPSRDTFRDIDIVFMSVNAAVSQQLAPYATAAGAVVIDDSSAFRMLPDVPLVIPEVNGQDVEQHKGIISIPNCATTQMVMALYPLHKINPIQRVIVDTYQSVSGTGGSAIDELRQQVHLILDEKPVKSTIYPHPIGFNVFPQIDTFLANGYTKEEWKMVAETRKILHAPEIAISATCVRVPVYIGHSEAIHVEFTNPILPENASRILKEFPGLIVYEGASYPTPQEAAGTNDVLIGRIRQDVSHPNGLAFWVVADNLRKGAALNAIQIAEELLERGCLN